MLSVDEVIEEIEVTLASRECGSVAPTPPPTGHPGGRDNARYATLNARAVSPEARALVDQLTQIIEAEETASSTRKNKRSTASRKELRLAIEALVADLLLSAASENTEGWCYRPLHPKTFTGDVVNYRPFKAVLSALKRLKLVEHKPGQQRAVKNPFDDMGKTYFNRGGRASRFKATGPLLTVAWEAGVEVLDARRHFREDLPKRPLVLKSPSIKDNRGRKTSGRQMNFVHTEHTRALEAQVLRLNELSATWDIGGGPHGGWRRIFNEGAEVGYGWDKGGRLNEVGETYQSLPRNQRLLMTLNGSPVVEIDVTASHLTILHGLTRYPLDLTRDPYEVDGFDREVVKAWATATISNADQHQKRWSSRQSKEFKERYGRSLAAIAPMAKVREPVEACLPIFKDWGQLPFPAWAMLQFLESEAFISTMLELAEQGMPCLSVHDSLIVRVQDQELAQATLSKAYEAICGLKPRMKVHSSATLNQDYPEAA